MMFQQQTFQQMMILPLFSFKCLTRSNDFEIHEADTQSLNSAVMSTFITPQTPVLLLHISVIFLCITLISYLVFSSYSVTHLH